MEASQGEGRVITWETIYDVRPRRHARYPWVKALLALIEFVE